MVGGRRKRRRGARVEVKGFRILNIKGRGGAVGRKKGEGNGE